MKLLNHVNSIRTFKNDPFGFIVDTLIRTLVNLIVPIPLAAEAALQFKGPILGCLVSLIILGIFLVIVIGTVVISPFLTGESFLQKLIPPITSIKNIPSDGSFTQTSSPVQIPLGGQGLEYAVITAGFHDPAYFLQFGTVHTGIDLVPNNTYYQSNQSYKQTHQVVVYATLTGTARYYVDSYGGMTVENTNLEGTLKVIEIHMKQVFVKTGDSLKAGTPVGIMGQTGHATGEHVHYEIREKQGNAWVTVNPLQYIR